VLTDDVTSGIRTRHLVNMSEACGVVCIVMREDAHVNILPSPKGLALEMEHERSDWTNWLELRRSGECSWSWPVRVRVTLRLTVGQSVCLGVEPRPGLMTRCSLTL
jgi:hypothetical protein